MKTKINVLDTNVFLYDPNALNRFHDELIIIPLSVIQELDKFKKDQDEKGRNSRTVTRMIDNLISGKGHGKISHISEDLNIEEAGIELSNNSRVLIELNHTHTLKDLDSQIIDNRILSVAVFYQKEFNEKLKDKKFEVFLVTKDANLRIKADAYGIKTINYESDQEKNNDEAYLGYRTLEINSSQFEEFISRKSLQIEDTKLLLNPNEYIILKDKTTDQTKGAKFDYSQKKIISLIDPQDGLWGIHPKNLEQQFALDALLDDKISLVTLSGKAGTGKTLLSIAVGLFKTIDEEKYKKLLITRPVYPMGKDIGFLPGDIKEKMNPWMQPFFDNLEFLFGSKRNSVHQYEQLIDQKLIQIEALTYIRGRSIPKQFFILDEMQNATKHEIKTILSRAGEGTKIILTGDPDQIDNPYVDKIANGLSQVIEAFKGSSLAAHVTLQKGERSKLAEESVNLIK